MRSALQRNRQRLDQAMATLNVVSPLATLERGYAIITREQDQQLIRHSSQLQPGDPIRARLGKGEIRCLVDAVE
jgi:exodeoxyribonuclease VII large subunit